MFYLIAALASLLLGVVAIEPRRYAYWLETVSQRRIIVASLGGQGLVYVLAGLLAARTVVSAGFSPEGITANALGGLGAGLVPHGLALVPVPRGSFDLRTPKTWLGRVLHWLVQLLDFRAELRVDSGLAHVSGENLIELTWSLYWNSYFPDRSIRDPMKAEQRQLLKEGERQIRGLADASDGTGRLRGFCSGEIKRRYLYEQIPRTPAGPGAGS